MYSSLARSFDEKPLTQLRQLHKILSQKAKVLVEAHDEVSGCCRFDTVPKYV